MTETVTLEQAKKLKEWGFPQEDCSGYWYKWVDAAIDEWIVVSESNKKDADYAAPTLQELIEWLNKVKKIKNFELTYGVIAVHEFGEECGYYADCSDIADTQIDYNALPAVYALCEALYGGRE